MKQLMTGVIKAVIDRRLEGMSYGEISIDLRISKSTVHKYLQRIMEAGLSLEEAASLERDALAIFVRKVKQKGFVEPDFSAYLTRLKTRPRPTRTQLFEEYRKENPGKSCSYATFCRGIDRAKKESRRRRRFA